MSTSACAATHSMVLLITFFALIYNCCLALSFPLSIRLIMLKCSTLIVLHSRHAFTLKVGGVKPLYFNITIYSIVIKHMLWHINNIQKLSRPFSLTFFL